MSSISVNYSRKRPHSPEFRDSSDSNSDSEYEAPSVKLKRKKTGTKVPVALAARLKKLVLWMSELPVKGFFTMAVKAGCTLPDETIVIDEDDDDVVPIEEDEDEEQEIINPFLKRFEQSRKYMVLNRRSKRDLDLNGSCHSRYQTRGSEVTVAYDSRFDSINGSSTSSWRSRHNGDSSYNLRSFHYDRPAPISNPETDVEILLDATSTPEPDDIEILEPATSQRPIRRVTTVRNASSQPGPSTSSALTRSQSSLSKSYTAHEVVRLQEKAQYQLLLEKYLNGNQYRNVVRKPNEADEQDEPDDLEFTGAHFKKEVLQQPVNTFLEKYCKPCQLVPHKKPKDEEKEVKEKEVIEITLDDDDEKKEEEVAIVDIKLPKYIPKYHQKANFFSAKWINELKKTVNVQTEERLKIVQEQEKMLEKFKKDRLLEKLNLGLPDELELPALTTDMQEMVDKALCGDPKEVLCKITSDYLHRKDIETLGGLNWLNDLVINSYFDLIVERSKQEGYPSIHAYNTFFYSTYKSKGYSSVRRWTRKTDIFSYDLNFVPIHLGVHWCLGVIDHRSKKICYYDSMGSGEDQCLDLLHEYLCLEHKDKKGTYLDPSIYTTEIMKNNPQQMNGSDCGMFTLKYAEYISRDAELTFTQKNMEYFRRRMVYELITCKLL